jgi:WXG100 family type VII secretion target
MAGVKSGTQIMMDFNKARSQATKLENAAASIRREANRFTQCRSDVAASWTGDNASRFVNKMGLVSEDLMKIAKNLEQTAATIRKNAKTIYDAEMEAKRIAEIRTSR